jgi:hypothetical protein
MTTRHNPGDTVYIRYMPPYGSARITKHVIAKVTKTGYTLTDGSRVAFDGHNKSTRLIGWATAEQVAEQKAAAQLDHLRLITARAVSHADAATLHRVLEVLGIHHTAV